MKTNKSIFQFVAIGLCLASFWAFAAQPGSMQGGYYQPAQQADTNQQNQGDMPDANGVITVSSLRTGSTIVLGGTVIPQKEITLSAQIPGRIEYIAGAEGDWFEQSKLLVAIDDDDLLAKRRQAVAELTNVESAMRNAEVQYSRELWAPQSKNINRAPGMGIPSMFDQFFTRNMGSMAGQGNPQLERHADLYLRGTNISQAQSRVISARSKIEGLDTKLRDSKSIAPFYGVIVSKLVDVGDTVQPGQPLLLFADAKILQIKVDVPARLMPGIQPGMIVPAILDVRDTHVDVRVAQIFPMADVQRHTVTVKFDLPEGAPAGPGMYAKVMIPDINAPERTLPVIPKSAVVWRGSLPGVMVINKENQPKLHYVRLGEKVDDYRIEVLAGLREGERILANASGKVSGGSQGSKRGTAGYANPR